MVFSHADRNVGRTRPARRGGGIALAALLLHAVAVHAGEGDAPVFSVNGFGSLGMVHSSESNADFNHSYYQYNGAGAGRSWSPTVDSRLGVQGNAALGEQLSAVVQIISEQQWDGSFRPIVEWANVKYEVTPAFSIRVGRIALQTSMLSESQKVGYTLPWVRTPVEVNRLFAVTNSDGVDATYRSQVGQARNSVTAYYGKTQFKLPTGAPDGGLINANDLFGLNDTLTYGAATLHAGYLHTSLYARDFNAIPALSRIAREIFAVKTVGASYDPGAWFVNAEALRLSAPLFGVQLGWYASAGARFGKLTPYVTYAHDRQVKQGINPAIGQKTVGGGLRVDVAQNVDVKLQYEHQRRAAGSVGTLTPRTGFEPGGKADIVSAVVDFVF